MSKHSTIMFYAASEAVHT